jgi:hypothetical protein
MMNWIWTFFKKSIRIQVLSETVFHLMKDLKPA